MKLAIACFVVGLISAANSQSHVRQLTSGSVIELPVAPKQPQEFRLALLAGESAQIEVLQIGADVVIDLLGPNGLLIDSFDGPTGRNGVEQVAFTAKTAGDYLFRVRAFDDSEPEGKFRLTVRNVRTASETKRLLAERVRLRLQAAQWLKPLTRRLTVSSAGIGLTEADNLRQVAAKVSVVGLGEATHGSREFNDARLAITKELVRRCGFRLIAVEWSASRARELEPYANGQPIAAARLRSHLESIWIGPRIRHRLYAWARFWNQAHPKDRVTVIGVDAGDNEPARTRLFAFLREAYRTQSAWTMLEQELKEADAQTPVFGDTGVSALSRSALMEIQVRLSADSPMLERRFGMQWVAGARDAVTLLFEFADFNAGRNALGQSRDWYMAMRILRGLKGAKAVYWAHNAHVATTKSSFKTTGRLLREALGDKYCAIGATCGTGSFVAQIPNDLKDRLAVSSFLPFGGEAIEDVLSLVRQGEFLSLWRGAQRPKNAASFLTDPQLMHWIGGLFTPGSPPSTQYRPFRLTTDFDGIVYIPRVSAEDMLSSRPLVPARKR
jgi:erythromycin esterase